MPAMRLFALAFLAASLVLLVGCSQETEVHEIVVDRYRDGTPRKVEHYSGERENRRVHRHEIYHHDGTLVKLSDYDTGEVLFYDELQDTLRTPGGLRAFLRGMWRRQSTIEAYRLLPNNQRAHVQSREFWRYRGDTLSISHFSQIRAPSGQIQRQHLELGLRIQYRAPSFVSVQEQIYSRSGSSIVPGRDSSISADAQQMLVDTLRIYRPDLFAIHTAAADNGIIRFQRVTDRDLSMTDQLRLSP